MNKIWMALATGIVWGTVSLSTLAQTATGSTGSTGATGNRAAASADAKSTSRAAQPKGTADQSAQARCNSRKGADQKTCLEEVRARQQARGKVGGERAAGSRDAVPAVQTQSAAVTATGVAPSTTGPDPVPGTPAIPRK